jgi:fructokinase
VLSMLSALERKTAFIGKVGSDGFGILLKDTLEELRINTDSLLLSDDHMTTLAFVNLTESGDRSFSFARKQSADIMLDPAEIPGGLVAASRIFHCGSLSLTDEPVRSATFHALDIARKAGVSISVDPNLRELLWNDLDAARTYMLKLFEYADIIKISDYELTFLFGSQDVRGNMETLCRRYEPKVLFATCGENGAYVKCGGFTLWHKSYTGLNTIDTTGAGDAFLGAALHKLLEHDLDYAKLSEEQWMDVLQFASAAAAIVTTRKGALKSMPVEAEILKLAGGVSFS